MPYVEITTMSPAHNAIAIEDLETLRDLLDAGADINEEHGGLPLLHRAIDVEVDGHAQTREPLQVSMTAYLIARGADPRRKSNGGKGVSAEHFAFVNGHWLASAIIAAWINDHPVK